MLYVKRKMLTKANASTIGKKKRRLVKAQKDKIVQRGNSSTLIRSIIACLIV